MKTGTRWIGLLIVLLPLLMTVKSVHADGSLELTITIDQVKPPTNCTAYGWSIYYQRTVTQGGTPTSPLRSYFVQYVNDDLNLAHYWGSGYDAYVQDYMVYNGTQQSRSLGGYAVPLLSATYRATTVEYVLVEDALVWEIRVSLECKDGKVISHQIVSQVVTGNRSSLPKPGRNLILALEDIPLYRNPSNRTGLLGTIKACQTFYISEILQPRASIFVYARESLTGTRLLLAGGTKLPLVDVPDNYGQAGGEPILDQCVGK